MIRFIFIDYSQVEVGAERTWFASSELLRDAIQKKHQCCGFLDTAEDIRCTHIYSEVCGNKIIQTQANVLKLVSALVFITTSVDMFLFVIAIFLSKIYAKQDKQVKKDRNNEQIIRSNRL